MALNIIFRSLKVSENKWISNFTSTNFSIENTFSFSCINLYATGKPYGCLLFKSNMKSNVLGRRFLWCMKDGDSPLGCCTSGRSSPTLRTRRACTAWSGADPPWRTPEYCEAQQKQTVISEDEATTYSLTTTEPLYLHSTLYDVQFIYLNPNSIPQLTTPNFTQYVPISTALF